jgi:hypothetical protein
VDYVLFGMGYGASLMLLGWALRTFGPQLKYSRTPHVDDVDFQVEQRFWVRFIQGLGGVVAIAGTAMVLMTFVVVLVNPDDDTGGLVALAIWAFIMITLLLWCWMYVRHYGLTGVWSRSGGYGFRKSSASRSPRRSGEVTPIAGISPKKRLIREDDVDSASPSLAEADPVPLEIAPAEQPGGPLVEDTESEAEEAESEPEDTAVYDFGDVGDTTVPSDAGGRSEALRRLRERQARARQSSN